MATQRVTITFETDEDLFAESLAIAALENEGIYIRHASGEDYVNHMRVKVEPVPSLDGV